MPADRYWRAPPDPLLSASSLAEFVVLDCEPADGFGGGGGKKGAPGGAAGVGGGGIKDKALWEVVVSGRGVAWWSWCGVCSLWEASLRYSSKGRMIFGIFQREQMCPGQDRETPRPIRMDNKNGDR